MSCPSFLGSAPVGRSTLRRFYLLGRSESALRRGFRPRRKRSYGANAPSAFSRWDKHPALLPGSKGIGSPRLCQKGGHDDAVSLFFGDSGGPGPPPPYPTYWVYSATWSAMHRLLLPALPVTQI